MSVRRLIGRSVTSSFRRAETKTQTTCAAYTALLLIVGRNSLRGCVRPLVGRSITFGQRISPRPSVASGIGGVIGSGGVTGSQNRVVET